MSMLHSRAVKPRISPWNGTEAPSQIDRLQDISGDWKANKEKQYEIGRDGILGYKKNTPGFSCSAKQFEYGSMDFWRALANVSAPASAALDNSIDLDDIKSTKFDISASLTDDDNIFKGTVLFPKLRINGFSINIGDPEAIVERNFDFVGEDYKILDGNYYAYETATIGAPGDGTVTLSPVPVEYAAGKYIFKVLRVRSGAVSELEEDALAGINTWKYDNGTKIVTVKTCLATDVLKVYYESATAYATLWTNNDSDPDFLRASACDIFIKVGLSTKVYQLQSVGIDVKFDRTDYREIGDDEVTLTGTKSKTVTIALDRYSTDFALEDILAGDTTYPYINPRDFSDNIQLMIKIYEDSTKTTFKMGYLMKNISPQGINTAQATEDYNKRNTSLETDELLMSNDENEIVFS
ncbi:MAG: hypothetical protein V1901_03795 [Patescibacteria group bacterium]